MTDRYASSASDPSVSPIVPLPPENKKGHLNILQSNINLPNPSAATDRTIFGSIPSNAKIERTSDLFCTAITGLTSWNLGLYAESLTTPLQPDYTRGAANCLMAAQTLAAAAKFNFDAITPANGGKNAWELAGLATDPGGVMYVVGTIVTGPSSVAGDVDVHVKFRTLN